MLGMYTSKCVHQCPELTWKQLSPLDSTYILQFVSIFLMQMWIYDARVLTENQNLSENEVGGLTFSVLSLISPLDR